MRDANIKKLVLAALMAALTYVATSIVQIPSPMQGFVNLGDCIVLLSGWILGPWWGAAAGGIGSMLVDLLGGYGHYAPASWSRSASPCPRRYRRSRRGSAGPSGSSAAGWGCRSRPQGHRSRISRRQP